jgi:hypothetical protein
MRLKEKQRDDLCKTLWSVEGSLKAIAGLVEQMPENHCFDQQDLFGLSQLLRKLTLEVSTTEDILRSGRNSRRDQC